MQAYLNLLSCALLFMFGVKFECTTPIANVTGALFWFLLNANPMIRIRFIIVCTIPYCGQFNFMFHMLNYFSFFLKSFLVPMVIYFQIASSLHVYG